MNEFPVSVAIDPPVPLNLSNFTDAMSRLKTCDFYILVCHESCLDIAKGIKFSFKHRGCEVGILLKDNVNGSREAWFLHGMKDRGPPFCVGTVFSNVPG